MLTGGRLRQPCFINKRSKNIKLMCLIAVRKVWPAEKDHSDVDIFAAAVDECLNEHGYIVPGLGTLTDCSAKNSFK